MKQNRITKSARGKACTLKLDGCLGNETVVFCHKNGAGTGTKMTDDLGRDIGFYGCANCHQIYDSLVHEYYKPHFIEEMAEFAITRTKRQLVKAGIVGEEYTLRE